MAAAMRIETAKDAAEITAGTEHRAESVVQAVLITEVQEDAAVRIAEAIAGAVIGVIIMAGAVKAAIEVPAAITGAARSIAGQTTGEIMLIFWIRA